MTGSLLDRISMSRTAFGVGIAMATVFLFQIIDGNPSNPAESFMGMIVGVVCPVSNDS